MPLTPRDKRARRRIQLKAHLYNQSRRDMRARRRNRLKWKTLLHKQKEVCELAQRFILCLFASFADSHESHITIFLLRYMVCIRRIVVSSNASHKAKIAIGITMVLISVITRDFTPNSCRFKDVPIRCMVN
jgi:hypothetical protein